ncbi:prepilin-type N-terminal cleavage/methylation domain-containing protein [Candidatus Sumerlaeota bacterium]|nr:prepilin-type N-terminal cleavage/methylation domain-containing protein [Candidatus Sumerlaeota bacterium]
MFIRETRLRRLCFTLIELLIVVAIIAILAAIAVPNFLEAQTRAKVSRVKADMRTITTAVEAYRVDYNGWPTGWGILVDPARPESHSLFLLSTPVQYITSGDIQDVFHPHRSDEPMWTTLQWDPMTPDGRMFSQWNIDSGWIHPGEKPTWWCLFSVGPDHDSGFYEGEVEFDVQVRVAESDDDIGPFLATVYDPTNGSVSIGNIWRAGGGHPNQAGMHMH